MKPIIVFDLDGTLVHTAPDLIDSLDHALAAAGLTRARPGDIGSFVGLGGRVMIERSFAEQGRRLAEGELDRLTALFLDHYGARIPGKSAPYPGAVAALERLAGAGFAFAVCTNKYEGHSRRLLTALGMADHFGAICGQDTFLFRKPDPRHLTEAIRLAGGDPGQALMVGDSRTDIDTAKAAGIPVLAVDFGYTDRPVREFEPSHVISHFDELTAEIAARLIAAAEGRQSP